MFLYLIETAMLNFDIWVYMVGSGSVQSLCIVVWQCSVIIVSRTRLSDILVWLVQVQLPEMWFYSGVKTTSFAVLGGQAKVYH